MGVTDIFKNSNEKKLMDRFMEVDVDKINDEMNIYSQYERMRQTWSYEGKSGLYHKMKKGEDIRDDIDNIKKDKGYHIIFTKEIYKRYINYLNYFKENYSKKGRSDSFNEYEKNFKVFVNSGSLFLKDFKVYKNYLEFVLKNKNVTQKEQMGIIRLISNIKSQLKNIDTSIKKLEEIILKSDLELNTNKDYYLKIEEVQNWLYGENNFYNKGLQKIFNDYKDIYDLIMKCNKDKFLACVYKYIKNKKLKSLEQELRCIPVNKIEPLVKITVEMFGRGNRYEKKFVELMDVLNNDLTPKLVNLK
ncbi:MAG: hypothetical protein IJJ04_03420 [Clostridia bacterium]|nr:hypothetical protein [Clostridia bacterium]